MYYNIGLQNKMMRIDFMLNTLNFDKKTLIGLLFRIMRRMRYNDDRLTDNFYLLYVF